MIRIFCDLCEKDITNARQFNCTFTYELPVKKTYHTMKYQKGVCLCEKCNSQFIERVKDFF